MATAGATNSVASGITFDGDYNTELTVAQDPTLATTHQEREPAVSLYDATFSRTAWRLYCGAKGLVMWY
jgi:hypothetical protein